MNKLKKKYDEMMKELLNKAEEFKKAIINVQNQSPEDPRKAGIFLKSYINDNSDFLIEFDEKTFEMTIDKQEVLAKAMINLRMSNICTIDMVEKNFKELLDDDHFVDDTEKIIKIIVK